MGEPRGPQVCDESAADRLWSTQPVQRAVREHGLTREHVAAVLHGLADHTALEAARVYDRMDRYPGTEPKESTFCPTSLSIGRWLHDTADQIEGGEQHG